MRTSHWTAATTALALILSLAPTPAGAGPPAKPLPSPTSKTTRITLITGDHVKVTTRPGQPDQVVFEPGPGSGSTSAVVSATAGHTVVIPSAAGPDVASGRLDRALFDVTIMVAEHRDDAGSATLPVIIRYAGSSATALGRARQGVVPGAAKSRVLTSIGARATSIRKNAVADFWASLTPGSSDRVAGTIQRVTLDRQFRASLDKSVPQIGGPAAWQRGLTGKGVKIAILDTGIDTGAAPGESPPHADLAGRIEASANFSDSGDTADRVGHGTHVASIAAGTGAASGGKYKGVAPDATLLNGKVLDDFGFGSTSGIIAGMEWAAAQGATVANLSLGGAVTDGTDELSLAVNRISHDTGMLMVVAAGNCFDAPPQAGQVNAPASADAALAVGNLERDGSVNETSCRGPRKGDGALKPEISAPGTEIVAARSEGTDIGTPVGDYYTTLSGTSMAAPHVAGTAALIAQAHPGWKAEQLKSRLISTADPQDGSTVADQGAGRVDADQATDGSVTVDAGTLDLGKLSWPYPATDPVSRDLTYTNPTDAPVTLQLAASVEPAKANPKLSTDHLVVPAHGVATVTVTADRAAAGTGTFSGRITATAAGADPLVTLIGWYAEQELHTLTVNGIERDGSPANELVVLTRVDGPPLNFPDGVLILHDGTGAVRLPPGRYATTSAFYSPPTDTQLKQASLVVGPETILSADATITLDARRARPVAATVRGREGLALRNHGMQYIRKNAAGELLDFFSVSGTATSDLFATPTPRSTIGSSEFSVTSSLTAVPQSARSSDPAISPDNYELIVPWPNRIPADPQAVVDPGRLARVDETFGSHLPDANVQDYWVGLTPAGAPTIGRFSPVFKAPTRRTTYLLANEVQWTSAIAQGQGDGSAYFEMLSTQHAYRPGTRSSLDWTRPVVNSGLPAIDSDSLGVRQAGGNLQVYLSPFGHGRELWSRSFAQFDQSRLTVDRNGTQIKQTDEGAATDVEVPAEAAQYKVGLDSRREFEDWKYSTRVQSVWTFRSTGTPAEVMPLVLADLDVPQSDDLNQVQTGVPVTITLGLRHQAGSKAAAFIGATLEISYDGTTWAPLPLKRTAAGRYAARVSHPAANAGTAPSLRLTATDAAGNKLEQEVTKAYGLK